MAGISNFLADHINDWLHGNAVGYSPPGTTYFALMLSMPSASGGGLEASATGYSRLAVTNNSTNWPVSSLGVKQNGTIMSWAAPSANIGVVLGIAEYDAATSGNLLTFSVLNSSVSVLAGQIFSLPVGGFTFLWSGGISQYLSNKLNDWLHGAGVYTVPSPTYFGLMQTASTQTTTGVETGYGNYGRVSDTNNATNWPASSGQTKLNANAITWPIATTNASAAEVAVTEFDAASSGNVLTFGSLSASVVVNSGATPAIPISGAVYVVS